MILLQLVTNIRGIQNNPSRCFLQHILSIQFGCLSYYVCILTNIVKLSFNI